MSNINEDLESVKFLTNSSLSSIIGGVNNNFTNLTRAVREFLDSINYDQNYNSASLSKLNLKNLQIFEKISVGTIDAPDNVTIDANGRITANSFLVEVAEAERLRLKNYQNDLNTPGLPGEMIYLPPSTTYPEGFYGYFMDFGWVKLGGTQVGGGGSGANNLYELDDVNLTNPQNGSPLIYDSPTNKWIDSPFNISDFFSNLTNLTQYKIPYWNGTSLADSNVTFSTLNNSITINGDFYATTKSFLIDHPSKKGFKLRHGNLEGPEHGVYIRGRSDTKKIELPDYWKDLVDISSITVQVTPIGKQQKLYVQSITKDCVTIGGSLKPSFFYTINAERKDVEKMKTEIKN